MPRKQQRVTLGDVARVAEVSMMTVSRVINNKGRMSDETRQRVLDVIDKLGYRPNRAAQTLVTNRTNLVGFVVPDITNPYFAEIFEGVEDTLREESYNVLVANTNETTSREKTILQQLENGTVDGLISCSSRMADEELFPLLERYPNVVSITRPIPKHMGSLVVSDHHLGFRALSGIRYLHEIGHRKIAYVGLKHYEVFVDMNEFKRLLAQDGIYLADELYVTCEPKWKSGYEAGYKLLQTYTHLDAVVGGNDLVALGIMRAALDLGIKIPDDLSIIGADDILLASQVSPPLTTFHIDKYQIGAEAAKLLLQRIAGDTTYREYQYKTELIIRGSTRLRDKVFNGH
jgi:LacI family transcriptional regulator